MEINYKKNDNKDLFKKLNDIELTNIDNLQNYCPLYNKYFKLNNNNYNSINLNNKYYLADIINKKSYNKFDGILKDICNNNVNKEIFFKYSPLLDPIKYLLGKYENICDKFESNDLSMNLENLKEYNNLYTLPIYNSECDYNNLKTNNFDPNSDISKNNSKLKLNDEKNTSYVDCFFSFLSSKLLNNYNFINGLDFYGSYLGIKNDFLFNIEDDIDILSDSDFFLKSKNLLYKLDKNYNKIFNYDTRNNKTILKFKNIHSEELIFDNIDDLNIESIDIYENNYESKNDNILNEVENDNFFIDFSDLKHKKKRYIKY